MRLIDVLTQEELHEVERLKQLMYGAKTQSRVKFYSNKIQNLLLKAKERYYASCEISHD